MEKRTILTGAVAGGAALVLTAGVAAAVGLGTQPPDTDVAAVALTSDVTPDDAASPLPATTTVLPEATDTSTGPTATAGNTGGSETSEDQGAGPVAVPAGVDADRAAELAVAARPGTVLEVELSDEYGRVVWDVDVRSADGRLWDVYVDAADGSIVEIDLEDGPGGSPGDGYDDGYDD